MPDLVKDHCQSGWHQRPHAAEALSGELAAAYRIEWAQQEAKRLKQAGRLSDAQAAEMVAAVKDRATDADLPRDAVDRAVGRGTAARRSAPKGAKEETAHWGILGLIGLNRWLVPIDDATRSPFAPYGLAGIMLGAVDRLLRLHRLRLDLDARRRSPQPAARRAPGHPHLAAVVHACSTWPWPRSSRG